MSGEYHQRLGVKQKLYNDIWNAETLLDLDKAVDEALKYSKTSEAQAYLNQKDMIVGIHHQGCNKAQELVTLKIHRRDKNANKRSS